MGEGQRLRWKSGQPMLGSEKPHSKCPGSSHPHPHLGSQLCQESSPCAAHQHGVAAMATGMQGQAHPSIVNSPASKPGLDRAAQVSKKVGGPWLQGSSPYLVCAHGCPRGRALATLLQTWFVAASLCECHNLHTNSNFKSARLCRSRFCQVLRNNSTISPQKSQ